MPLASRDGHIGFIRASKGTSADIRRPRTATGAVVHFQAMCTSPHRRVSDDAYATLIPLHTSLEWGGAVITAISTRTGVAGKPFDIASYAMLTHRVDDFAFADSVIDGIEGYESHPGTKALIAI